SRLIVTFCFPFLLALAMIPSLTRTVRVARISRVVKTWVGRWDVCGDKSPKNPIRLQVQSSRQFSLQKTRREIVEKSSEIVPLGAALPPPSFTPGTICLPASENFAGINLLAFFRRCAKFILAHRVWMRLPGLWGVPARGDEGKDDESSANEHAAVKRPGQISNHIVQNWRSP
ncbi:MAG: hypothetical protein WBE88_08955, partial [Candidatus Acidiferrales bacterium]